MNHTDYLYTLASSIDYCYYVYILRILRYFPLYNALTKDVISYNRLASVTTIAASNITTSTINQLFLDSYYIEQVRTVYYLLRVTSKSTVELLVKLGIQLTIKFTVELIVELAAP